MIRMIGLALLLVSSAAQSQSVYKCRDGNGNPSYQSQPCEDGRPEEKRWDTEPRRVSAEDEQRRRAAEQAIETDRRALRTRNAPPPGRPSRATGAQIRTGRNAESCDAAKARREASLRRSGLKRSFNLLRRLDDDVWRACNR